MEGHGLRMTSKPPEFVSTSLPSSETTAASTPKNGCVDDVINVSGHRLGTMEVESSLVSHESVVEAAVVGVPHDIKGTGIAAFCTLAGGYTPSEELKQSLREHVGKEIGAIAKPDTLTFTDALPKTRSGKIMRRLLRDVAAGTDSNQDVTTLEDFSVLAKLRTDD